MESVTKKEFYIALKYHGLNIENLKMQIADAFKTKALNINYFYYYLTENKAMIIGSATEENKFSHINLKLQVIFSENEEENDFEICFTDND
ncbi:hypothetical protein [Shewanella surugensis]|uniref:Uncharacterized protein n=1 Tax=Shewanella surugensis TaxID=212020 RepID=A0ABT0LIZ4_9GAMM|nr:hypothetical protein [Shewanella surugensis]MCL1127661.1 hypothetical protein [Shewanella surugensis]